MFLPHSCCIIRQWTLGADSPLTAWGQKAPRLACQSPGEASQLSREPGRVPGLFPFAQIEAAPSVQIPLTRKLDVDVLGQP